MLDLDHPKTKHVFAASALQDALSARAGQMAELPRSERKSLLPECLLLLDKMSRLNQEQFGASPFIENALLEAQTALERIAACDGGGTSALYQAFREEIYKMDSFKGFGTCAI